MTYILEAPKIVTRDEWERARAALLVREKELTRANDKLNAERRKLPMVDIDKEYTFEGPEGKVSLSDLFSGKDQLIVRHLMFHPEDEKACSHCSFFAGGLDWKVKQLRQCNTALVAISRAPLAKLQKMSEDMGWNFPWYSSYQSQFNHDFDATRNDGEVPAASIFLKQGNKIYMTYATGQRGLEQFMDFGFVDATPLGRHEEFEEPKGRAKPLRPSHAFPYPNEWE